MHIISFAHSGVSLLIQSYDSATWFIISTLCTSIF